MNYPVPVIYRSDGHFFLALMSTLNPQVPLEARQAVLDQIVAGASFTAYEITLEVRRRLGASVDVPHGIVNSIVQTMFANGEIVGYDRAPDTTVRAATPPFRYAPRAARVGRTNAPAVSRVNRSNLPVSLRYANPLSSIARQYGLEARSFHDAAGVGNRPFDVWLPTAKDPRFRLRSYGVGLTETEVESRYSLSSSAVGNFGSKAAYSYADEFRVTTYASGTVKTFRAALDFALTGTLTKDGERATREADGVEIEIPIKPSDIQTFVNEASIVFAYFRVTPQIHSAPHAPATGRQIIFEGRDWKILVGSNSLVVVGDISLPLNMTLPLAGTFSRLPNPVGVELRFEPGEVEVSENGESLVYSDKTRAALQKAFERVDAEVEPQIQSQLTTAPNIWEVKVRFAALGNQLKDYLDRLQQKTRRTFEWNRAILRNNRFDVVDANETTITLTWRPSPSARLRTQKVSFVEAQPETVVFFNDLGTRTGSPGRLREYFAAHPKVRRAYVLTFISDAAKERFIATNNFESVPTQLLSSLPKPASSHHVAKTTSRIPFDPEKHGVLAPQNQLAAAFPYLNDANFALLERWAYRTKFDGQQWPDFKRLYKKAELLVWPIEGRKRWDKRETDLPDDAQLPDERAAFLLGVLIGQLDSVEANRGDDTRLFGTGPTAKTVAYLTRRAARLLVFLRDHPDLSEERRALLVPLVAGSMVRTDCSTVASTVGFRLNLLNGPQLENQSDLVRHVWSEEELALPVLKWAFEWLQSWGEKVEGSLRHVRRFIGDADVVLTLLPTLLERGVSWPSDYGSYELSRDLRERTAFQARRGEVLRLFVRFSELQASADWLWNALSTPEADETEIVRFATPLVENRAQKGELEAGSHLAPRLRQVFWDALVTARPQGLSLGEWQRIADENLIESLAPALVRMPLTAEIAAFLWERPTLQTEFFKQGGEEVFIAAFASSIQNHAQQEDFVFASQLPAAGRTLFFDSLGNLSASAWRKLSGLDSASLAELGTELERIPLSESFWYLLSSIEGERRAELLEMVGRDRAVREFEQQPSPVLLSLLESDTQGLESLVEAWLKANLGRLPTDAPIVLHVATSTNADWNSLALAHVRTQPLSLRVALRLVESGLPEAQNLARPYFENEDYDWAIRTLALADSPVAETRVYALELLARFPTRWTSALLEWLAQHDDTRVQAFVAFQLEHAHDVAQSEAAKTFDEAILNARGRARRAKGGVQRRLQTAPTQSTHDLQTLLDAARNGAPRDKAWALQQLVQLQLSGVAVPDLNLSGAVATSALQN